MITKGDDYPLHQTAEPIAYAGTDRNFYDRYWFNGYTEAGDSFFAVAFGVYPHVNIMDGSFSLIHEGVQYNVRCSRHLGMERLDTTVGPLSIEVVEPLRKLRIRLADNDSGITADLLFESRAVVVEEPRFSRRVGPRTFMDYTRMTQNGTYRGWINFRGQRIEVDPSRYLGTRDRSWGVRPIGMSDPQPPVPAVPMHMFWLWAPLNFADAFTLYHLNADEAGEPWNTAAVMGGVGDDAPVEHMQSCCSELQFPKGSRHASGATVFMTDRHGGETVIELTPKSHFYMSGVGYLHPEWGHGMNRGPLAVHCDEIVLSQVHNHLAAPVPLHLHVQALVTARMQTPDGRVRTGCGVLEQLILGPYSPYGFKELLDGAA